MIDELVPSHSPKWHLADVYHGVSCVVAFNIFGHPCTRNSCIPSAPDCGLFLIYEIVFVNAHDRVAVALLQRRGKVILSTSDVEARIILRQKYGGTRIYRELHVPTKRSRPCVRWCHGPIAVKPTPRSVKGVVQPSQSTRYQWLKHNVCKCAFSFNICGRIPRVAHLADPCQALHHPHCHGRKHGVIVRISVIGFEPGHGVRMTCETISNVEPRCYDCCLQ